MITSKLILCFWLSSF